MLGGIPRNLEYLEWKILAPILKSALCARLLQIPKSF